MPKRTRRTTRRYRGSGGILTLVVLLLGAVILLYLLNTGRITAGDWNIPITGPAITVPTFQLPLDLDAEPEIQINDTPIPVGGGVFGGRTKTNGCTLQGVLPDPGCTPGAALPVNVEQLCAEGYTNDGGPGRNDAAVFAAYDVADDGSYQIDHLVPLSLGGSNDPANLWTQPLDAQTGPAEKDRAEAYLKDQVCSRAVTLEEAQRQIAANWLAVYNNMP